MGKPLDNRNVEYFFDTKWLIQWNIPVKDNGPLPVAYNHNAILIFDAQSSGRQVYKQEQSRINLGFSSGPLTIDGRLSFISDSTIQNKIRDNIITQKLDKTGHQYTVNDAPPVTFPYSMDKGSTDVGST